VFPGIISSNGFQSRRLRVKNIIKLKPSPIAGQFVKTAFQMALGRGT
jgi:hypothetical protein